MVSEPRKQLMAWMEWITQNIRIFDEDKISGGCTVWALEINIFVSLFFKECVHMLSYQKLNTGSFSSLIPVSLELVSF